MFFDYFMFYVKLPLFTQNYVKKVVNAENQDGQFLAIFWWFLIFFLTYVKKGKNGIFFFIFLPFFTKIYLFLPKFTIFSIESGSYEPKKKISCNSLI